ncbi:hypothetical protein [Raineyella fluvialis]|uniref:hypothetical protein n=1 Tax=Raineyella fluvialis TaxID=2662261 RepID=UPI001E30772D|nr:hypothetical protein [Raineyella fluvialis]
MPDLATDEVPTDELPTQPRRAILPAPTASAPARGIPLPSRALGDTKGPREDRKRRSDRKARRDRKGRNGRRRRWLAIPAALVAAVVLWTSVTLGPALAAPGTDTTIARIAEWARDQHLGGLVTLLEQWQYQLDPPKSGGTPDASALKAGADAAIRTKTARPATIRSQAGQALPGEGEWHSLYTVKGDDAALVASLRPDAVHTSYVVHVVWMDPKLNSFVLHPGTKEPGPVPGQSSQLSGSAANTVLATFNSGFKMSDARGGYWQAGHTVSPLQAGAASMVLGTNGSLKVISWPGGTRARASPRSGRTSSRWCTTAPSPRRSPIRARRCGARPSATPPPCGAVASAPVPTGRPSSCWGRP